MILTLPNILTLARVAVIPLFVGLFFLESAISQWIACGLFALAAITDFFDGYFARARAQLSAFGTFLDPIADKLLVASALLMMVGFGQIAGVTIIAAVIILCREILVSGLREYLAGISVVLPVSRLAKWKTTVQMVAISFLIVGNTAHPTLPDAFPVRLIGEVGLWIAAAVTLITGYDYLKTGLRHMDASKTTPPQTMKTNPHIFGITGWSGSGKTHLVVRLIPELRRRGFRVSTVKHAHHTFDVDQPGKDSFEHRAAGASEVMIASARRWALLHENIDDPEPGLDSLLNRMSPTDVVLVEGFKDGPHQKIEVYRAAVEADPICRTNRSIIAIASDGGLDEMDIPVIDLNDTAAIADFIVHRIGGAPEHLRGGI